MSEYEFGCFIDCSYDECIRSDCKYYGDCPSCRWFWECTAIPFGCEHLQRKAKIIHQKNNCIQGGC